VSEIERRRQVESGDQIVNPLGNLLSGEIADRSVQQHERTPCISSQNGHHGGRTFACLLSQPVGKLADKAFGV
jgi:hypothetical protein